MATAQGCSLPADFKQRTLEDQSKPSDNPSIMYQDYLARRPMEVETFLGSPIKLAETSGVKLPRIETLYAILHNLNTVNQSRPKEVNGTAPAPVPPSPTPHSPMPRMSGAPRAVSNGMPNGNGMARGPRPRNSSNFTGPPPGMRRPPPPANGGPPGGYRPQPNGAPNGYPQPPRQQQSRRGSLDEHDLGEFSHLVLYDEPVDTGDSGYPADNPDIAMRERELQIRQRELALKEQEMRMRRGGPGPGPRRRGPPPVRNGGGGGYYDDDDEEDDFFDPNPGPPAPMIDPDNFDMMSVTSRKNRSKPPQNHGEIRSGLDGGGPPSRGSRWRPGFGRNRSSQVMASAVPGLHDSILDDPLMGYSSNRYGDVDRGLIHQGSRANSLTASHLHELNNGPGMSGPYPRRASQSPGNPYSPSIRGVNGRPSPPNGMGGPGPNGRPSPPDGMRQPVPRYPPGHGNSVAPQQVEQRVGVSSLQPPKSKTVRSLTGSASASAGSGDSSNVESEPSAHSSQSSLGPRPPVGVR